MKTLEQLRIEAKEAQAAWLNTNYPDNVAGDMLALDNLRNYNAAALEYNRALKEASK